MCKKNKLELDEKIISWAQYLQWANINFNRFFCEDDIDASTSIALAFQWYASEYIVIEGWCSIKQKDLVIDKIISDNEASIDLLRKARNAVFHYQKKVLDNRLLEFVVDAENNGWLYDLHENFQRFLYNYPSTIYPYQERKDEFNESFYKIIGWKPYVATSI